MMLQRTHHQIRTSIVTIHEREMLSCELGLTFGHPCSINIDQGNRLESMYIN